MTGSAVPTVPSDGTTHPLHALTRVEVRTANGLLFSLFRDPDPAPFFLLYPLTSELPAASVPYVPELEDERGPGWEVNAKDPDAPVVTAQDLLVATTIWTTALFNHHPACPTRQRGGAGSLEILTTVHAYGDHENVADAPLLYVLDNILTTGGAYWALRLAGAPDPAASLMHMNGGLPGATALWEAKGVEEEPSRLRSTDLLSAATVWALTHGPAHQAAQEGAR